MLEAAVTEAMADDIGTRRLANGQRSCGPKIPGVFVANVDGLRGGIADGIVRPRCELILLRVQRPCAAAAVRRRQKPEFRIGDHVDPRRRRPLPLAERHDVFAPLRGKPAESVEELERRRGARTQVRLCLIDVPPAPARHRIGLPRRGELIAQCAAPRVQHRTRGRQQEIAAWARHKVGAQQESLSALREVLAAAVLGGADDGIQRLLQTRRFGRRPLIQNDKIHVQLLDPPIVLRTQQLLDDSNIVLAVYADQHDRQIAG